MNKFLKKLILFSLPILFFCIALTVGYFVYDPFKLVYKYDIDSIQANDLNRDYVTTERFIKHNPTQKYNSFVFGSSRSMGYNPASWATHLGEGARPFSFDASSETIVGIYLKLRFLDRNRVPVNNALMLVDADSIFFDVDRQETECIKMKHPITLDNSFGDWFKFQKAHFFTYTKPKYLVYFYGGLLGIKNKYTVKRRVNAISVFPTNCDVCCC
ncbi:hypothetical protein M2132_000487 [Dysgonomonas sp. PH5-45]|uniref:hypothetical protein n=1 Tax=unclassified Dysgonomonas TaxID=2630389 RepID=UPI0024766CCE|nr:MULTISPECIES: hypothetical protein [unclassified Dysgonomonas]MDH6354165.1 hypothetical protein [Dysgonomonas sp. PH5-45]MDH6386984.1 hypothetical protein [Dysgonomonas sp. PH5-37]